MESTRIRYEKNNYKLICYLIFAVIVGVTIATEIGVAEEKQFEEQVKQFKVIGIIWIALLFLSIINVRRTIRTDTVPEMVYECINQVYFVEDGSHATFLENYREFDKEEI